jgi:uncharacterized membrane protein
VTVCAVIVLAATAVVAPYFSLGYYLGHDIEFHVSLWFATARQWGEGVAYARWAGQVANGYGDPALLFYPPLSRILGGALVACLPSRVALGAFGWLGILLGGFSFFCLCREFFDDRSSLAAAFAYAINPYILADLYIRCAFAEFLAAALFPLFILTVLRLGGNGKRSVALLALMIALLWLTSIPGAVIANYIAALVVLALAWVRKSKSILGLFLLAEVLGAGLAAFYLFPAWYQQGWIHHEYITGMDPLGSFLLWSNLYVSATPRFAGILNTGFFWQFLVGGTAWLYASKFHLERRDVSTALATVAVVSMLMTLPVSVIVWICAPFLSYVQFPWRWLFPFNLAVSFFLGAALSENEKRSWFGAAACAYSLLLIFSFAAIRVRVLNWQEFAAPFESGAEYGVLQSDEDILVAGDYVPIAVPMPERDYAMAPAWAHASRLELLDQGEKDRQSPLSGGMLSESAKHTAISVQSWETESRVFTVDSPQPARVQVRLFYYPGWHVSVNGSEVEPVEVDRHGVVVVRVPSGHSLVRVEFKRTPSEIWGMIISGMILIFVAFLFFARPGAYARLPRLAARGWRR